MSEGNVEGVRAFLQLWNGRKLHPEERPWDEVLSHPLAAAYIDPETVYADNTLPDHAGEEYRGRDGIRRATERWMEDLEWLLVELEDIIDADEHVVSIHEAQAKMRHTGLEFRSPLAYVWTFRDGKLVRYESFVAVGAALQAAGLEG